MLSNNSAQPDRHNQQEWAQVVSRLVRTLMARHQLNYSQLSERLRQEFGTLQLENNLRSKVSRGTLGAQLLLQILAVCNGDSISSDEVRQLLTLVKQRADH